MTQYIDVGCAGGSCPKQEQCRRFHIKDEARIVMQSAPFNFYKNEGWACNYYEKQKEEKENT